MRLGVIGGTFNPIHNGHLYIASEALRLLKLDKIIFIPAGNPPHKQEEKITDAIIRSQMVKAAVGDYSHFEVSDYEVNKRTYSYTYETLEYLKRLYKEAEIFFITGADCLINLYSWKKVPEILELCNFVVLSRSGYSKEELEMQKHKVLEDFKGNIILLDLEELNISSTDIRNRIKNEQEYKFFVPEKVYGLIEALNLYR